MTRPGRRPIPRLSHRLLSCAPMLARPPSASTPKSWSSADKKNAEVTTHTVVCRTPSRAFVIKTRGHEPPRKLSRALPSPFLFVALIVKPSLTATHIPYLTSCARRGSSRPQCTTRRKLLFQGGTLVFRLLSGAICQKEIPRRSIPSHDILCESSNRRCHAAPAVGSRGYAECQHSILEDLLFTSTGKRPKRFPIFTRSDATGDRSWSLGCVESLTYVPFVPSNRTKYIHVLLSECSQSRDDEVRIPLLCFKLCPNRHLWPWGLVQKHLMSL